MSVLMVRGWKCDVCGHIWLAEEKPKRCARCKKVRWDLVGEEAVAAEVDRQVKEVVPVLAKKVETILGRVGHDAKTCRVYRCGLCAALQGEKG